MSNSIPSRNYSVSEPVAVLPNSGSTIPADERLLEIQKLAESGDFEAAYSQFYVLIADLKSEVNSSMRANTDAQGMLANSRAELILENVEKQLDQIKTMEKSQGMEKFMKIFQPVMLALTVVTVLVAPTPLTIGLLITSVGMYADQAIAEGIGTESLFTKTTELVTKGLDLFLPEDAASIIATVTTSLAAVAVSVIGVKGVGSFKSVQNLLGNAGQALKIKVFELAGKLGLQGVTRTQLVDSVMSTSMYVTEISETSLNLSKAYYDLQTARVGEDIAIHNADVDLIDDAQVFTQEDLREIISSLNHLDTASNTLNR